MIFNHHQFFHVTKDNKANFHPLSQITNNSYQFPSEKDLYEYQDHRTFPIEKSKALLITENKIPNYHTSLQT